MSYLKRDRPLVAVLSATPLLSEALGASLEDIADVQAFRADIRDPEGLLRALQPEAVVVDDALDKATVASLGGRAPVVQVSLRNRRLRLLRGGSWTEAKEDPSPEAIRNVLIADLIGGGART